MNRIKQKRRETLLHRVPLSPRGTLLHVNGPLQPMIMTKYELANKSVTWKTFTIELAYDSLLAVRTVN